MALRNRYYENYVVFIGGLAVVLTAFLLTPDPRGWGTHEHLHLPPCFFLWLTHRPCPTCGLTTSFAYLAKGDIINGARIHPMGPPLFMALLVLMGSAFHGLVKRRSFWRILENKVSLWTVVLLVSGLSATWVARFVIDERLAFAVRSF